jgi:hypothetical protein
MKQTRNEEVWDLVTLIQRFHIRRHRVFKARRAYDTTMAAVAILWPVPPAKKPRGLAAQRRKAPDQSST